MRFLPLQGQICQEALNVFRIAKRMLRCLFSHRPVSRQNLKRVYFTHSSFGFSTMNKLKAKLEGAFKTTAMSAQQIYKHKSFNLSKTQEDPE